MSYVSVGEIRDAFVYLYGNEIINALRTGLRIANINKQNMIRFSIDKDTVEKFLFGLEEESKNGGTN